MNVLIIGSGAREHAVADAFSRSNLTTGVIVCPGNDGIAQNFRCEPMMSFSKIVEFCRAEDIGMVFIGPEQPIAEGLSDILGEASISVVAPSKAAARLESSKAFAKDIMNKYGIPTAAHQMIHSIGEAETVLSKFSMPVVLKADGLAAGKGVIIATDLSDALNSCAELLEQQCGSTGVLAEEFLTGWEASLFAVSDGTHFKSMLFAQDHKQLQDADLGPNTGGMGAFCPVLQAEPYRETIEQKILKPILDAMRRESCTYRGILYLGLMITASGPKVIEFNCRLGDPETQAVLPLLETDFMEVCLAVCNCQVDDLVLKWKPGSAVAVVLASPGYPGVVQTNIPITIPHISSKVYFGGVKRGTSDWLNTGGRVMSVVALADTLELARAAVYRDIKHIEFPGMVYRTDIGRRRNEL